MPHEAVVWLLAQRYQGWTLEYIENLPLRRVVEESQVQDALHRYRETERKLAEKRAKHRH